MKKPHRKSASRPDFKKGLREKEKLKIKKKSRLCCGAEESKPGPHTSSVLSTAPWSQEGEYVEKNEEKLSWCFLRPEISCSPDCFHTAASKSSVGHGALNSSVVSKVPAETVRDQNSQPKYCCLGKRRLRKRTFFCRTTAILGKFTVVNGSVRVSIKNSD